MSATEEIIELKRPYVPIPPPSAAIPPCMLTVVQTVYHQPVLGDAASEDCRLTRVLESDEQPYIRKTRIGDEWQALYTDWVKNPGLIVLRNEGTQFRVNPTVAEREEAQRKSILVGLAVGSGAACEFARVRPGEQLVIEPRMVGAWRIRCESGSIPITLAAYPR